MKFYSILAASAAFVLALTSVNAANEIRRSSHGSLCQATSLGQAINFNARWTAKGIRNTNSVESGKSFFVVCPIESIGLKDITSTTPGISNHYVEMSYQDLTTSVAECTFRRYNYKGELVKSVVGTSAAQPSVDSNFIIAAGLIDANDEAIFYAGDNYSVVCALNPQSTVLGVSFAAGVNAP